MARILIAYFKIQEVPLNKINCMWDGLFQEFKNNGNDVFAINTAYFNTWNKNNIKNKKLNSFILTKAKEFNPEIIITFNHRIPQCILDNFNGVPTIIWDGDELRYFCDLDYIKENIGKYKIFSIAKEWQKDYLDFGFNAKNIYYLPIATSVQAKNIEQDKNISFLGDIHYNSGKLNNLIKSHKYENICSNIYADYLNNNETDYVKLFKKHFKDDYVNLNLEETDLYPLFNQRILVLSNLLDFGLKIYGERWDILIETMPWLAACFNTKSYWTLAENEEFYNSSIISISPIHPQARGKAFPWRVFDVMASNACLVSERSGGLKELTKKYIDLPMFHTPYEAREICKNLLNDEKTRKEIVLASQKFVNENARWTHRFKEMETFLDIKLVDLEKEGKIYILKDDPEFLEIIKENKLKPKDKLRLKAYKHLDKILKRKGII